MMIYRCVAMFILPDADFADDAEERRSFIVLKENKSAFFCVICARLRPVNTSKHTVKSSFISLLSQIIQNIDLSFLYQAIDHFSEQCVYPGKPRAGELSRIVLVE